MVEKKKDSSMEMSRRSVLVQGALCATGVATVLAANVEAAKAALPQSSVAYRDKPNGTKECDNCQFFKAPNACEKVAGTISPKGYCILWHKKA